MKDAIGNKVINSLLLIIGEMGLIWDLLQEEFNFFYLHPAAIFSLIIFLIGVIRIIMQTLRFGFKPMRFEIILVSFFLLLILGFSNKDAEIMKSAKVIDSVLLDDLTSMKLILREDGSFEMISKSIFGKNIIKGKYQLIGDTILLQNIPEENGFISNKILIDRDKQRLWTHLLDTGKFDTTEYFEISYIKMD